MGERGGMGKVLAAVVAGLLLVGGAVVGVVGVAVVVLYLGVQDVQESAKVDTTQLAMMRVAQRVEIHALRNGVPGSLAAVFPDGVPTDGWGRPFVYVVPGPDDRAFDLMSHGADGQPGGTGPDADIRYSDDV
jgi:general secretion pathway protein G